MEWKESKVSRKRRKKVEFDLDLLEGKTKRRGIGITPVRSIGKKRGDKKSRHRLQREQPGHVWQT
ncbi:MAG TPA: hypothetical protein VEG61_05565 [Candidatus Dormibacteraeota bacterium]|nr:hypothetical protein [Candidatus Dormibacteraeota bacterium]